MSSQKSALDESSLLQDKTVEEPPKEGLVSVQEAKVAPRERHSKDIIIVIDDSPANLTIICGLLKKLGHSSLSFRDPLQALQHIESLDKDSLGFVRAIFSDFAMPGMDGIALLKELRSNERTKTIPFVMITSNGERDNIRQAGSLKVNHYLLKPITANLINETVAKLFPPTRIESA
jgi:two-component system chemotaxis response regulator CheY